MPPGRMGDFQVPGPMGNPGFNPQADGPDNRRPYMV